MFYCSYVSIHYIICECGDTFPTEDELKEHLKTEHNNKLRIERNEYRCDTVRLWRAAINYANMCTAS